MGHAAATKVAVAAGREYPDHDFTSLAGVAQIPGNIVLLVVD